MPAGKTQKHSTTRKRRQFFLWLGGTVLSAGLSFRYFGGAITWPVRHYTGYRPNYLLSFIKYGLAVVALYCFWRLLGVFVASKGWRLTLFVALVLVLAVVGVVGAFWYGFTRNF